MAYPILTVRTVVPTHTHMFVMLGDAYDRLTPTQPSLAMVRDAEKALGGEVAWDVVEKYDTATRMVRFCRDH